MKVICLQSVMTTSFLLEESLTMSFIDGDSQYLGLLSLFEWWVWKHTRSQTIVFVNETKGNLKHFLPYP